MLTPVSGAGRLVQQSRRSAGLSLRELARRAQVPVSTIHRIERGMMNPTIGMLDQIAAGLGAKVTIEFPPDPRRGVAAWVYEASRSDDPRWRVRLAAQMVSSIVQASPPERLEMLATEPASFDDLRWDGFAVALAEHLALLGDVPAPAWTHASMVRSEAPWWVVDHESLRPYVLARTPLPFKIRSIYIDRDALENT